MMTSSNGNIFRVTGHLCGEFTGPGEFPPQRPVTRSFDVFFDLHLNKRLTQWSWSLWRQCSATRFLVISWVIWAPSGYKDRLSWYKDSHCKDETDAYLRHWTSLSQMHKYGNILSGDFLIVTGGAKSCRCLTNIAKSNCIGTIYVQPGAVIMVITCSIRDHSGYGLNQWEKALHRNVVSHWLGPIPRMIPLNCNATLIEHYSNWDRTQTIRT